MQNLSNVLEHDMEELHQQMKLTNLSENSAFFNCQVDGTSQQSSHRAPWRQLDSGCGLARFDPLPFHPRRPGRNCSMVMREPLEPRAVTSRNKLLISREITKPQQEYG